MKHFLQVMFDKNAFINLASEFRLSNNEIAEIILFKNKVNRNQDKLVFNTGVALELCYKFEMDISTNSSNLKRLTDLLIAKELCTSNGVVSYSVTGHEIWNYLFDLNCLSNFDEFHNCLSGYIDNLIYPISQNVSPENFQGNNVVVDLIDSYKRGFSNLLEKMKLSLKSSDVEMKRKIAEDYIKPTEEVVEHQFNLELANYIDEFGYEISKIAPKRIPEVYDDLYFSLAFKCTLISKMISHTKSFNIESEKNKRDYFDCKILEGLPRNSNAIFITDERKIKELFVTLGYEDRILSLEQYKTELGSK